MWFFEAFSDIDIILFSSYLILCLHPLLKWSLIFPLPLSSSLHPAIPLYPPSYYFHLHFPPSPSLKSFPYLFFCSTASPLSSSPDILSFQFIPLVRLSFKFSVMLLGFWIPPSFQLEPSLIFLYNDWILSSSLGLSWLFPWVFACIFLGIIQVFIVKFFLLYAIELFLCIFIWREDTSSIFHIIYILAMRYGHMDFLCYFWVCYGEQAGE